MQPLRLNLFHGKITTQRADAQAKLKKAEAAQRKQTSTQSAIRSIIAARTAEGTAIPDDLSRAKASQSLAAEATQRSILGINKEIRGYDEILQNPFVAIDALPKRANGEVDLQSVLRKGPKAELKQESPRDQLLQSIRALPRRKDGSVDLVQVLKKTPVSHRMMTPKPANDDPTYANPQDDMQLERLKGVQSGDQLSFSLSEGMYSEIATFRLIKADIKEEGTKYYLVKIAGESCEAGYVLSVGSSNKLVLTGPGIEIGQNIELVAVSAPIASKATTPSGVNPVGRKQSIGTEWGRYFLNQKTGVYEQRWKDRAWTWLMKGIESVKTWVSNIGKSNREGSLTLRPLGGVDPSNDRPVTPPSERLHPEGAQNSAAIF